ncbi:MAG: hypothetical protein Q9181_004999 [Wetmoreana brouardii]
MAPRVTRGAAAKEAALQSAANNKTEKGKIAPAKKKATSRKTSAAPKATRFKTTPAAIETPVEAKDESNTFVQTISARKRKRATAPKHEEDPDELPHGLGKLWKPSDAEAQTADSDFQEPPAQIQDHEGNTVKKDEAPVSTVASDQPATAPTSEVKAEPLAKNSQKTKADVEDDAAGAVADPISTAAAAAAHDTKGSPMKKSPKKKANPYGLTPGVTPYSDWPHPTPEECQTVNDLLSSVHGNITPPDKIPEPSLTVAGCGEVPCVLDAMIRTLLSASTSGLNSSRAFQGLIKEYGRQKTGIGKGSVDWDAVRRSPLSRVFEAIKTGGQGDKKSKHIKALLDMVYEENQARRAALLAAAKEPDPAKAEAIAPAGAENESQAAKDLEIAQAEEDVLSLDHFHAMSPTESFNAMLRYPGIGVKTASCVTLFCLRHPSFAVDTHVFRLCQWLGWVPKGATRDKTFSHCDVRVPDGLKYSLHQLFIKHGKTCGRCNSKGTEKSEGWKKGCVIDHLVAPRFKTGKEGGQGPESPVKKGKKGKKGKDDQAEEDEDEMDVDDEEGSDFASPLKPVSKKAKPAPKKTPAKRNPKAKEPSPVDEQMDVDGEEGSDFASPLKPASKKAKATPKKTPAKRTLKEAPNIGGDEAINGIEGSVSGEDEQPKTKKAKATPKKTASKTKAEPKPKKAGK